MNHYPRICRSVNMKPNFTEELKKLESESERLMQEVFGLSEKPLAIFVHERLKKEMQEILNDKWRLIEVWDKDNEEKLPLILSPDGKRFTSLGEARDFINEEEIMSKCQKKKEKKEDILRRFYSADGTPTLSETAKIRRKKKNEKNLLSLRQRMFERDLEMKSNQNNVPRYQKYVVMKKKILIKSEGTIVLSWSDFLLSLLKKSQGF